MYLTSAASFHIQRPNTYLLRQWYVCKKLEVFSNGDSNKAEKLEADFCQNSKRNVWRVVNSEPNKQNLIKSFESMHEFEKGVPGRQSEHMRYRTTVISSSHLPW